MTKSKSEEMHEHISGIQRNYPDWPSTFGPCATVGCTESARGCGLCAYCHESKLAGIVGGDLAFKFHHAIKRRAVFIAKMKDKIDGN